MISWLDGHFWCSHLRHVQVPAFLLAGALVWATLAVPVSASGQVWWWRSPINPGFDPSTVIRVNGTVTRVSLDVRSGRATLTLECPRDTYLVMLGPGWYLAQVHMEVRDGNPLAVEGSKMMDRSGNLYLVAARVTNERTGAVLELRDGVGRPRWRSGPLPGGTVRSGITDMTPLKTPFCE